MLNINHKKELLRGLWVGTKRVLDRKGSPSLGSLEGRIYLGFLSFY